MKHKVKQMSVAQQVYDQVKLRIEKAGYKESQPTVTGHSLPKGMTTGIYNQHDITSVVNHFVDIFVKEIQTEKPLSFQWRPFVALAANELAGTGWPDGCCMEMEMYVDLPERSKRMQQSAQKFVNENPRHGLSKQLQQCADDEALLTTYLIYINDQIREHLIGSKYIKLDDDAPIRDELFVTGGSGMTIRRETFLQELDSTIKANVITFKRECTQFSVPLPVLVNPKSVFITHMPDRDSDRPIFIVCNWFKFLNIELKKN